MKAGIVRYLENINNNIVIDMYIYICFQGDEIGGLKGGERRNPEDSNSSEIHRYFFNAGGRAEEYARPIDLVEKM